MTKAVSAPWASGPGEILQHALALLRKDNDTHRRLAMILIDNAVELMLKTYLGLPQRVTGIKIGRERFREISESFPKLLDAVEEHAATKLAGIDLGQIEWYHRLRNELYHQGNGLTVERQKVDVYAELAKLLFRNLFEVDLPVPQTEQMELVGAFLAAWTRVERGLLQAAARDGMRASFPMAAARSLEASGKGDLSQELDSLRVFRNQVVHGQGNPSAVTPDLVQRVQRLAERIEALRPGALGGKS